MVILLNIYDNITYNGDIAELVSTSHGIIVDHTAAGEPAWVRIISEYNQLVLLTLVADKVETLLDISHHYTVTHRVDTHYEVRNVL